MNEQVRYVLYARKSSESDERQVQSIEDQINSMREYARRTGIQISVVLSEAVSARVPGKRPEFKRMLAMLRPPDKIITTI